MTPDFERCERLATDLLYKQDISDTKIDILKMKFDKTILFDSIQNFCDTTGSNLVNYTSQSGYLYEGCTIYDIETDCYVILHNDEINHKEHINWTRAHEIGHIYMGHLVDDATEEIEAHYFAAQLLMPEYVMRMMRKKFGSFSPDHTCNLFNVSMEAAKKRINTMEKKHLYNVGKKNVSIYKRMESCIDAYACNLGAYKLSNKRPFIFSIDGDIAMLES